jgi:hypothetical protein
MMQSAVTAYEFQQCIVNHNLQADNDEPLDFSSPFTLGVLDPKIGNEISEYIRELHEFDSGNSSDGSGTTSPAAVVTPKEALTSSS